MRAFEKIRLVYILIFLALFFSLTEKIDANENKQKKEIEETLNHIFKQRAGIMINQNIHELETHYLINQQLSSNAYRNEKNRINYVNEWAKKRAIRLVNANSDIRLVRLNIRENTAIVSLVQSFKLSYDYLNKIVPVQTFGVGTRHFITLKKIDGKWIICKEWYLDPLDENPNKIAETPNGIAPSAKAKSEIYKGKKYNRSQAISYANKYAGAALGAGNNHRYNRKYLDYTGQGGDCTNFSSQVIGDVEAGGLPMTGAWRYIKGAGGSQSWIRTDSFSNYILRSGYGELVSKGDLRHIVTPTKKHPDGAISHIQPGDLIGYIIDNNDVDHFSIVVDFDKYGYPLVNSHTADRYRVPFDLGWDKNTKYVLIHIKD
ncbi:amidase domain-containing protein [Paenibacillus sp. IHBB 10380]|uniref:amidase domain-containing protein n=1 Tax=Paenibacillus sp. IHBB 10380 TaxID=1566358 RepID=UPI0005CFAA8E|nr:amidase domain-containing protein [Paenibacillus sp. IHBB 10380]AJS57792.1 hypothetical protein UB51_03990 [Paenibacillus sp. IHBB 10380]